MFCCPLVSIVPVDTIVIMPAVAVIVTSPPVAPIASAVVEAGIVLIGELIETVRHEIEHIVQNDNGMKQIDEPNESEEYYSQIKEIEAQRAGFKLRSEEKKTDFETLVRNWFNKYQHKHSLTTEQKERVIQKVISEK